MRTNLASRVRYAPSVVGKSYLIKNEWPLGAGSGDMWRGRLLGASTAQSALSWTDFSTLCLSPLPQLLLCPHDLAFPPTTSGKLFCKGDLIANLQRSLFSFHSTVFLVILTLLTIFFPSHLPCLLSRFNSFSLSYWLLTASRSLSRILTVFVLPLLASSIRLGFGVQACLSPACAPSCDLDHSSFTC